MSFAISIIGCIFGCRISNAPNYEYQAQHHFCIGEPEKNGCTNKLKQSAAEINTDLLKYYAEIQNIFKEFEVQEVMPTTQQLKEAFNMRMKDTSEEQPEEAPVSFWEVFDEFIKECGNQNNWTASTYEKFAA